MPPVTQQGRLGRAIRLAVVLGLVVGAVLQLAGPAPRDLNALLEDLAAGTVRSVTIEAPGQRDDAVFSSLTISWTSRATSSLPTVLAGPAVWLDRVR